MTLLTYILLTLFLFPILSAQEKSVSRQIIESVLTKDNAEEFFEAQFGHTEQEMLNQGYSKKQLEGAKSIIINSVMNIFRDDEVVEFYSKMYSNDFYTNEELIHIRDFYATKAGQKLFLSYMLTWKDQKSISQDVYAKHFARMNKELVDYFTKNKPLNN